MGEKISIENFLPLQIATTVDSDKHVMFSRLCKHRFKLYKLYNICAKLVGFNRINCFFLLFKTHYMVYLQYGEKCIKLVCFKKQKKCFVLKNTYLSANSAIVLMNFKQWI